MSHEAVHSAFKVAREQGISVTHVLILFFLNEKSSTMNELAKEMKFSTAASTGSVDRMEKLGLVARQHADDDRRVIVASITQKGRALLISIKNPIR